MKSVSEEIGMTPSAIYNRRFPGVSERMRVRSFIAIQRQSDERIRIRIMPLIKDHLYEVG